MGTDDEQQSCSRSLYPTCPICTLRLFCIPRLFWCSVSTQLVKAILNSKDFQKNIDAKQTPPKLVKSVLVGGWNSTHLKNMIVKMGSSSPNRGENSKKIELPPPRQPFKCVCFFVSKVLTGNYPAWRLVFLPRCGPLRRLQCLQVQRVKRLKRLNPKLANHQVVVSCQLCACEISHFGVMEEIPYETIVWMYKTPVNSGIKTHQLRSIQRESLPSDHRKHSYPEYAPDSVAIPADPQKKTASYPVIISGC